MTAIASDAICTADSRSTSTRPTVSTPPWARSRVSPAMALAADDCSVMRVAATARPWIASRIDSSSPCRLSVAAPIWCEVRSSSPTADASPAAVAPTTSSRAAARTGG